MKRLIPLLAVLMFIGVSAPPPASASVAPWKAFTQTNTADYGASAYGFKSNLWVSTLTSAPTPAGGASPCPFTGGNGPYCYALSGAYFETDAGLFGRFIEPFIISSGGGPLRFDICYAGNSTNDKEVCQEDSTDVAQLNTVYTQTITHVPGTSEAWNVSIGPYSLSLTGLFTPQTMQLDGYTETDSQNDSATCTLSTPCVQVCANQSHLQYQLANGLWTDPTSGTIIQNQPPYGAWASRYTHGYEYEAQPNCSPTQP